MALPSPERMSRSGQQVHKDYDDGMEQFDVKFYVGMTEYSYDIDANTGRIVDYDIEIDD